MKPQDIDPSRQSRWQRLERALDCLLAAPEEDREGLIEALAPGGSDFESELKEYLPLLVTSPTSGKDKILDRGALASMDELLADLESTLVQERVDRHGQLGPYELGPLLAVGGMGRVYRGHRADGLFEREVAIKVLRWELSGAGLRERFERERQILARIEHPAVAQLLDGGVTDDGVPYLVMELIEGQELLDFCQTQDLDLKARLRLILPIVDAVSSAHAMLVVHRDIKPSNILVNSRGEAKLLDFGVAKLLNPIEASDHTRTGLSLHTPAFASPEQLRGEPVGTASDVYSLGCVLWTLATDTRPFTSGQTTDEDPRRGGRLPPRPSAVAAERGGLWRDLDAVVLTALRNDPGQRYASAEALGRDVERLIEGRAVEAVAPSWRYHASRFLARHAVATALALVALLALIGASVVSLHQSRVAAAERDSARSLAEVTLDLLRLGDPGEQGPTQISARQLLEEGAARANTLDDASSRGELLAVIGEGLLNLQVYEEAVDALTQAVDALEEEGPDDRAAQLLQLSSRAAAGAGELDKALALNAEAQRRLESMVPTRPAEIARAQYQRAFLLARFTPRTSSERQTVLELLESAIELQRATSLVGGSDDLASSLHLLGHQRVDLLLLESGTPDRRAVDSAIEPMWEAARMRQQLSTGQGVGVIISMNDLALVLDALGRHEEAMELLGETLLQARRDVAPTNPTLLAVRQNYGTILRERGRIEEAREELQAVIAGWEDAGLAAPVKALVGLARAEAELGALSKAEGRVHEALERIATEDPYYWLVKVVQGDLMRQQGRLREAKVLLEEGLAQSEQLSGPDSEAVLLAQRSLASLAEP